MILIRKNASLKNEFNKNMIENSEKSNSLTSYMLYIIYILYKIFSFIFILILSTILKY